MIVADSDVLIDALRGREGAAERIGKELSRGSLGTTAITAFELRSGAPPASSAAQRVETLLAALPVLPFDERAAQLASEIRHQLEAAGTTIGMADYLIAGICLTNSAILMTRNRKHFERVPGLLLA